MEIFSKEVIRDTLNVIIHHFVPIFKRKKSSRSTNQVLCYVFVCLVFFLTMFQGHFLLSFVYLYVI